MNRRLAGIAALAAALVLPGCSSLSGRSARAKAEEPQAPTGRYAREAVPDAVMLPDQSGSFYRDAPGS